MIINNRICLILIILLIILPLIIFAPKKDKEIIYIYLQKQVDFYDNLEYDSHVAEILSVNRRIRDEILNATEDKEFLNASFSYLEEVYRENPAGKDIIPLELLNNYKNPIIADISYNLMKKGDVRELRLHNKFNACTIDKDYLNLSKNEIHKTTENFAENAANCLFDYIISKKNADFVIVGTDHALSLLTIKIAKKMEPESKIGLFVFDEHIDIYGLEDRENVVNKANVFGKILLEGYAERAVFLGTSYIAKNISKASVSENFTRTDMFKRIKIYSDSDIRRQNLKRILDREILEMKSQGITNIIVSVDVDVLPSQYTGFEYSMIAPAIVKIKYNNINRTQTLAEFSDGFSKGFEPQEINKYIRFIKNSALINGMKFGADKDTTKLLGDVQELLPKQDINFETTKATKTIADSFYGN